MQINLGNSMKFYFLIKQFKLNYLDEMTALAPKIVQGQTNVIKYNSDFFFFSLGISLVTEFISLL